MTGNRLLTILFICITSIASAQQKRDTTFRHQWKEIDSLISEKNQTQAALDKVNGLYTRAKQEQLIAQQLKCLLYRLNLEEKNSEPDPGKSIGALQAEINTTNNVAAQSILFTLIATQYLHYFNLHRWQYYNRSVTLGYNKEDLTTWGAEDFYKAITQNYLSGIRAAPLLQHTQLNDFNAVIRKGNTRKLRPTLYDLLVHEALDYFKTGEVYITRPAYAFTVNDPKALGSLNEFLGASFTSKDTSSCLLVSLQLFQQLLAFHQNDTPKDALIDINTERIQWVYNQGVFNNKDTLYKAALENNLAIDPTNTGNAQTLYLLANYMADKGRTYNAFTDTTYRYELVKAKAFIEEVLPRYKQDNEGVSNLRTLLATLNAPRLWFQTEKVTIPGKPSRALVSYQHIDTLYIRVIRVNATDDHTIQYGTGNRSFNMISHLPALLTWSQALPAAGDLQLHAAEIKIPALATGAYLLLISDNNAFIDSLNTMSVQYFQVSNISYIHNKASLYLLNRETGAPLKNVAITFNSRKYDNKKKEWVETPFYGRSNENGYYLVNDDDSTHLHSDQCWFSFALGKDTLSTKEAEYIELTSQGNNKEEENEADRKTFEKEHATVYFFTDRSIYRPGQTVYFKGIAITKDKATGLNKLYAGKDSILVFLNDDNDEDLDSLRFTVNEYGSFTGQFRLPQQTLTGRFELAADKLSSNNTSFRVEEYKRPTFYVTFDTTKKALRLNDSVIITGTVKAFAGNTIDNATVKYQVQRTARFFYNGLRIGRPTPYSHNQQIVNGELTTDANGQFTISFVAAADPSIDSTTDPSFDFSISADITDKNGETRSGQTLVAVGYTSMRLLVTVPGIANADSLRNIRIDTRSLAGQNEPALVGVKIYALQSPQRLVRSRYWQRPDQFTMTRAEYLQYFPNDDYDNDNNSESWPVSRLSFEGSMDTKSNHQFAIPVLPAGYYKIEATTSDPYGKPVKDIQYFHLFDSRNIAPPVYNFKYATKDYALPGETASYLTAFMADKVFVIQETAKPHAIATTSFFYRSKGIHTINYTATEADRGNTTICEAFVYDNRMYINQYKVTVPWDNKNLRVSYASYRNKTVPGSKEQWTITVQNNKGEKAAAELLTTLYDASLDQFVKHSWSTPAEESSYYYNPFSGYTNFSEDFARNNYHPTYNNRFVKDYDRLLSVDYLRSNLSVHKTYMPVSNALVALEGRVPGGNVNYGIGDVNADRLLVSSASGIAHDMNPDIRFSGKINTGALSSVQIRGTNTNTTADNPTALFVVDGVPLSPEQASLVNTADIVSLELLKGADAIALYGSRAGNGVILITTKKGLPQPIQLRKNFTETAFFFPQLHADTAGNFTFSFTMPESLTQWKWMSMAHTKDLAFGTNSSLINTQKRLMVQSNAPRFMREGDNLEFSTKITNLDTMELTGQVTLELLDATTNTSVDGWFQNIFPSQYFTVAAGQSTVVKFPITIPFSFNKPLTWRVVAHAKLPVWVNNPVAEVSDGEENTLPVVTNRTLVTESMPLLIKGDTTQHFILDKLVNNHSETLTHQAFTIEYTPNPIWYAVQALPYLAEYPYECAEQTFNRFYANALASFIVNQHPRIKQVLDKWRNDSVTNGNNKEALLSNLQKNEELKQVLLQETPWVLQATSEAQQKKNIALLFDVVALQSNLATTLDKLQQMQMSDGSFPWFKGGHADRYITSYILTGIGKLQQAGALPASLTQKIDAVVDPAMAYLDKATTEDYEALKKSKADLLIQVPGSSQVQYLYMRSFFTAYPFTSKEAYNYYYQQAKKYWVKQNLYHQALLGFAFYRNKEQAFTIQNILPSITQNAINSKQGLYWKNTFTHTWYQSPIEYQSTMINLLQEINNNRHDTAISRRIEDMKTWLILNKQTNNWKTTVATADACYALLIAGNNDLNDNRQVSIRAGNTTITNEQQEGTGYLKQSIEGRLVTPAMGNITVTTSRPGNTTTRSNSVSYGSVYWQYFEDLDKITPATTPLFLHKKLFLEKQTDKGKVLEAVNDNDVLKPGDRVVIRLELKTDRDMEYLQLKDMRAATMEPVNVLSSYKWQDGLGYYEATKDASTSFFISDLRKGTYVLEYPVFITHTGTFSAGIATIQCMYAPEFNSHSEGIKIKVAE